MQKTMIKSKKIILKAILAVSVITLAGCEGYRQGWPYPEKVSSVYVEMFDSKSLRRGSEYSLTDALCKQIEVQTPYKIISDKNTADSVIYGEIERIGESILSREPDSGFVIEKEANISVIFSWKDLNTGKMYADRKRIRASAEYTRGDSFEYAADRAVNKAAEKIVEQMRLEW